jgi:hypothetical protein
MNLISLPTSLLPHPQLQASEREKERAERKRRGKAQEKGRQTEGKCRHGNV